MRIVSLAIFSIISILLLNGCIASHLTFGNGKAWIPADFDPKKTTLLIEVNDPMNRTDKKMLAYMKKKYPYSFECVSYNKINGNEGKYADLSIYRYALVGASYSIRSENIMRPDVGAKDFCFYDRSTDKKYPPTGKGSSGSLMTFKPTINTIVKNFR